MFSKVLMAISLGAVTLSGCGSKHEHHEQKPRLLVTNPIRKDTVVVRNYVCQIHSAQHIELRALERGYLEKIYVDEGQFVKKGQRMFQIMPMLYQAELKKAEAEVNFVEIEYQNTKRLADSNVVAPNELALAEARLNRVKAELDLAQVHLGFTEIKAPFDGIMDHFHVRLGSLVEEGELLTTLSDNSEMWIYFNVPEAEYLDYKSKVKKDSVMEVSLKMANNKLFDQKGIVTAIEADFNNETGNIAFRATFPNPNGLLRHGETGNILVYAPIKKAMIIPQKATFEILDKKYVFVVHEDNTIHSRQITIGEEMSHIYVVTDGISEDSKILLEGLRLVREGDNIEYDFIEADSALTHLDLYAE